MKIEMGESLFYSWLRHVKECQIVQTNWKVSPQWQLQDEDALERLAKKADTLFSDKCGHEDHCREHSCRNVPLWLYGMQRRGDYLRIAENQSCHTWRRNSLHGRP